MDIIKRIFKEFPNYINKNGRLILEHHIDHIDLIPKYIFEGYTYKFHKDLSGRIRFCEVWKGDY